MKTNTTVLVLAFMAFAIGLAQNPNSKADGYFFSYSFSDAVIAYESDMAQGLELSPQQRLNLADSYFKTSKFDKAGELYVELFTKDSIMDNLQFNRMLQSLTNATGEIALDSLIFRKMGDLSKELIQNADFNIKMLKDSTQTGLQFNTFGLEANSAQSDFSATFYGDGILFSSGRPSGKKDNYLPSNESYLDIFLGKMDDDGQITSATVFEGIDKSAYHKATPYYAQQLNSFFYVFSNMEEGKLAFDNKGKNSLALGLKRDGGSFYPLLKDLSTSFYYPYYDQKSQRLYFAADFEGGYGGTDLYYVYTNNGQVMSAPINLGPRINSPGNEISPYIFENSLYFSSDIFYGLGGMDIYKSNINGDDFTIPVNLGRTINTTSDDFGFIIKNHNEGLLGYFSSNRAGGKGKDDIYGFMVNEKPGLQTFALKGKVVNLSGFGGVENATVRLYATNGELLQEVYSNTDGNYSIEVPWQEAVRVEATKNKYSVFSMGFDEAQMKLVQEEPLNLGLAHYKDLVEEREGQIVLKLKKFYFAKNQAVITTEIANELDKVVDAVSRFPKIQLRIETHTDSRGGSSLNFRLSQKRSDNIKKYLLQRGVPSSNILYSIGYGEDKLLNSCGNGVFCIDYLHKENQRSLIVVLNDNVLFK